MIEFALPVPETASHSRPYLTQSEAIKLAVLGFDPEVAALTGCAG